MKTMTRTGALVLLLILGSAVTPEAWSPTAQAAENPQVNVNFFRPSVHPRDILGIQTSFIPKSTQWGAGLWMTLQGKTLTLVDPDDNAKIYDMVRTRLLMDLVASFGIGNWVDVGIDLPLAYTMGEEPVLTRVLQHAQGFDLGDLRLGVKVKLFPRRYAGFGLAVAEDLSFPTATTRHFFGDKGATATTRLVLDVLLPRDWLLALNLGYRAKQDVRISRQRMGDHLLLGFGVVGPVYKDIVEVLGTLDLRTAADNLFGSEYHNALDLMGGVRVDLAKFGRLGDKGHTLLLTAAGGAGLLEGYGTPLYQATLGLTYMFHPPRVCRVSDRDGDGLLDNQDKCPLTPGLMAFAGCPDTDSDGLPDNTDQCPTEPGPAVTQGCPDRDGDTVRDATDLCPDTSGLVDRNGCPDSDSDGILDREDKCPALPGVPAYSGCPDTDGDTIIDPEDECPEVAGQIENHGCPTKEETIIRLEAIADQVYFHTGSADLTDAGKATVVKVSKMLKATKGVTKVKIVGHTDDRGEDDFNMALSQNRAKTVRDALIAEGIKAGNLQTDGKGQTIPVAPNSSREGRQKNRRVEFLLLD